MKSALGKQCKYKLSKINCDVWHGPKDLSPQGVQVVSLVISALDYISMPKQVLNYTYEEIRLW
jgi:hypothetical protein